MENKSLFLGFHADSEDVQCSLPATKDTLTSPASNYETYLSEHAKLQSISGFTWFNFAQIFWILKMLRNKGDDHTQKITWYSKYPTVCIEEIQRIHFPSVPLNNAVVNFVVRHN